MSETIAERPDLVEVVILSGPRRGQITKVDLSAQEQLTEDELLALQDAVGRLGEAFQGLLEETRGVKEELRLFKEAL